VISSDQSQALLFQYGSNMSERVLYSKIQRHLAQYAPAGTTPDLALLGAARLPGYRFAVDLFSSTGGHRVADIVESSDADEVWGALYSLPVELVRRSDGERSVLDRIEGHRTSRDPENYAPRRLTVELAGDRLDAWTYVGIDDARARCARQHRNADVSADYRQSIIEGATALAVPADYLVVLTTILGETP